MGDLRIANSSWDGSNASRPRFSVEVDGNFTISNTKDKNNLKSGEYRVDVKNGKPTINFARTTCRDGENELSVMWKNYKVFDALRKADQNDKNGEKLTQSDLESLRKDKAIQKQLGITVKYDADAKVYGLYGENDKKIFFDFE